MCWNSTSLYWWDKSSYSLIVQSVQKGVWWCPLDQSHQWRGQRKLPYLLPNIWRNFGEILGGIFWRWGNSWRICRERREGREGKAWLWIYGASAKILSLHIYIAQYIYMQWVSAPVKILSLHNIYIYICSVLVLSPAVQVTELKWIGGCLWAWLASV